MVGQDTIARPSNDWIRRVGIGCPRGENCAARKRRPDVHLLHRTRDVTVTRSQYTFVWIEYYHRPTTPNIIERPVYLSDVHDCNRGAAPGSGVAGHGSGTDLGGPLGIRSVPELCPLLARIPLELFEGGIGPGPPLDRSDAGAVSFSLYRQ